MSDEMLCPRCQRVMQEHKPGRYKCKCGARLVQLSFDDVPELEPCLGGPYGGTETD